MEIRSPITNTTNIKIIETIKTRDIIDRYLRDFNLDVSRFFAGLEDIKTCLCQDTGYKFFHPFNLGGDSAFYEDLQKLPWYYPDWKWEHQKTFESIKPTDTVLEIGCAKGEFLKKLAKSGMKCIGLELNELAAQECRQKGLDVLNETIQDHALNNPEKYDVVCSFQVLEHIPEVKEIIDSCVRALKPGGKLVIGVPNDDSFIGKDKYNLLSIPPHHMGVWSEKALASLEKYFDIEFSGLHIEPLQSYHFRYYYNTVFGKRIEKMFGSLSRPLNKFLGRLSLHYLTKNYYPKNIKGHTVLAEFIKK